LRQGRKMYSNNNISITSVIGNLIPFLSLFDDASSTGQTIGPIVRIRSEWKWSWHISRLDPKSYLYWLRTISTNLTQDSRHLSLESNPGILEYKAGVLFVIRKCVWISASLMFWAALLLSWLHKSFGKKYRGLRIKSYKFYLRHWTNCCFDPGTTVLKFTADGCWNDCHWWI
jgi:hypothetical protein